MTAPVFRLRLLVVLMGVTLVACSGSGSGASAPATGNTGSAGPSSMADLDQAFIDMMVPHHQAAVAMAQVGQERAEHDELRLLADDIVAAQEAEISQLRAFRQTWFGSGETPGMDAMPVMPGVDMPGMDMDGAGQTMDMTADVEMLKTADPFDKAFIEAMSIHHASAIAAAQIVADSTDRPEIEQIAADIIEAQQRELDQMQAWLDDWYPS